MLIRKLSLIEPIPENIAKFLETGIPTNENKIDEESNDYTRGILKS